MEPPMTTIVNCTRYNTEDLEALFAEIRKNSETYSRRDGCLALAEPRKEEESHTWNGGGYWDALPSVAEMAVARGRRRQFRYLNGKKRRVADWFVYLRSPFEILAPVESLAVRELPIGEVKRLVEGIANVFSFCLKSPLRAGKIAKKCRVRFDTDLSESKMAVRRAFDVMDRLHIAKEAEKRAARMRGSAAGRLEGARREFASAEYAEGCAKKEREEAEAAYKKEFKR